MLKFPNNGARSLLIYLPKNIFVKQAYHNQTEVLVVKPQQNKLHTAWPIVGECGVNVMGTLLQKKMHRFFMKSWCTLYLIKCVCLIARNGSIPAYMKAMV